MIICKQVSKRYPAAKEALRDISFELLKGEMAFLTGHSGAGKSTLLKLIALLERATLGQLIVNGRDYRQVKPKDIPALRQRIGIVLQDPLLLDDRTIFDNVALPLITQNVTHYEIKRRVRAALDKVNLLDKEKCYPRMLSSGEQQRVSIARAVVHKPDLLLADEPTGNLDPQLSQEIMHLFQQFQQVGVTVLIATHDLALIARLPCRLMTLHQGLLVT